MIYRLLATVILMFCKYCAQTNQSLHCVTSSLTVMENILAKKGFKIRAGGGGRLPVHCAAIE